MAIKIDKKIVDCGVAKPEEKLEERPAEEAPTSEASNESSGTAEVIQMHERVERPEALEGTTYKIKTPLSEHALYVTITDIVLNEGTEHELRRPFEIFINSKNMDHFQWIVALTRIMSAVFRKGGDVTFLVEELQAVFDPKGGYFKKGGKFMPSLVAEIGDVLEEHLIKIGLLKPNEPDEYQGKLIEEKRAEYLKRRDQEGAPSAFPEGARLCHRCHTKAMITLDNCLTCLNCGESKCG